MLLRAIACVVLASIVALGVAQDGMKQPAKGPSDSALAALGKLAFLRGTWIAEKDGEYEEETWSAPRGDGLIGCFRWQKGGQTTLHELLSIKAEGGEVVLRLRHFSGVVEPWKSEAEGVPAMRAAEWGEARVLFKNESEVGGIAACEYRCPTPDQLLIDVTFKDAKREALHFVLKRAG